MAQFSHLAKLLARTQANERLLSALPMAVLGWGYLGYAETLRAFHLQTIPVCVFHIVTGHPCPLCGMTRAFGCLFAGDLGQAMHFNVFAIPAFLAWLGMSATYLWKAIKALEMWRTP